MIGKLNPAKSGRISRRRVSNAVKFTREDGKVTIYVQIVKGSDLVVSGKGAHFTETKLDENAEYAEVTVEDTGIGISPQDQEAIFQGYFRTQEGKKAAKGFGFGLKIAREIVESHGSILKVQSSAGQGARFYFRLPACKDDCPYAESGICHRCRRRNPQALDTNLSNLVQ